MNQEEVWDKIAPLWDEYKVKVEVEVDYKKNLVKEFISNEKGNILDLGCGSGRNFFKVKGNFYGVDFSQKMLDLAEKNIKKNNLSIKLIKANLWETGLENDFFDKIIFMASLHCIHDSKKRKKSLKESYRILKSGGKMLITVWNKGNKRWKNKDKLVFSGWNLSDEKLKREYYLYDEKELISELENVGFKIFKKYSNEDSRNIVVVVTKSL